MDDSKTLEIRLVKLEECCDEYKVRVRELEEQLQRARPQERAERVGNPEFERDADRLALQLNPELTSNRMMESQKNYALNPPHGMNVNQFFASYQVISGGGGVVPQKTLNDKLFEQYEKTIHVAQLYKLAGNLPLADKYREDAEHLYTELQNFEDMAEQKWKEGIYPNHQRSIWQDSYTGRRTLPTSGPREGAASALKKSSEGGRKTRKNKVLHKR